MPTEEIQKELSKLGAEIDAVFVDEEPAFPRLMKCSTCSDIIAWRDGMVVYHEHCTAAVLGVYEPYNPGARPQIHISGSPDRSPATHRALMSMAGAALAMSVGASLKRVDRSDMTDDGTLIHGVVEARARSHDHPNVIVLPEDQAKHEEAQAKYQERMRLAHPDLRRLTRTRADYARIDAAAERRQRKARTQAKGFR